MVARTAPMGTGSAWQDDRVVAICANMRQRSAAAAR